MTRSRLPGLVPSRSASHSWNDGWVHADRSPVGQHVQDVVGGHVRRHHQVRSEVDDGVGGAAG